MINPVPCGAKLNKTRTSRDFLQFLPQPSPRHQEFTHRVNALFGVRLRMSVVVESRRCVRLTQAVPGKAFRGELVERTCRELKVTSMLLGLEQNHEAGILIIRKTDVKEEEIREEYDRKKRAL